MVPVVASWAGNGGFWAPIPGWRLRRRCRICLPPCRISGGGGGSVVGFPAWRFLYRSRPDTGRRWLDSGDGFGGVGSVFRGSAHPLCGGWGGLDAGQQEDKRAGVDWSAPLPEKRGVHPRLRTTTTIRYRFHLKPWCVGSFFGLGCVLAPSWVDGLRRLYPLYPLRRCLYSFVFMGVFLTV